MKIKKWDYDKNIYEDIEKDSSWKIKTWNKNGDKIVNCANCGIELAIKDGVSSYMLHTKNGIGYIICKECHIAEIPIMREFANKYEKIRQEEAKQKGKSAT